MAVSTILGNGKKFIRFDNLVFLEAQQVNLRVNLRGKKCDEFFVFYETFFKFYEKVPSPPDTVGSFSKYFYPKPR